MTALRRRLRRDADGLSHRSVRRTSSERENTRGARQRRETGCIQQQQKKNVVFVSRGLSPLPPPALPLPFSRKTESSQLILAAALIKTRACLLFPPPSAAIPHSVYQPRHLARLLSRAEESQRARRSVTVYYSTCATV